MENFNSYYDYGIKDLLSVFPADHKDKEGMAFWSGPKRAPSPIKFDSKNATHLSFVLSYPNLIALALGIPENRDSTAVANIANGTEVAPYVAKKIHV